MFEFLFWELNQQRIVGEATAQAKAASKRTIDLKAETRELRRLVNKLMLVTQALWEIVAETNNMDNKLLIQKVNEVDLRDGRLNGKLKRTVKKCASCGRTLHNEHSRCLYCGSENLQAGPFGT
jgi:predicted Zn-ribbon and HTH transcriptional regulator